MKKRIRILLISGSPGVNFDPYNRDIIINRNIPEWEAKEQIIKRLDEILKKDSELDWVRIIEEKYQKLIEKK